MKIKVRLIAVFVAWHAVMLAQNAAGPVDATVQASDKSVAATTSPAIQNAAAGDHAAQKGPERVPGYVLGPDDIILIRAFQAEELSDKQVQIAADGYISLPLVGRIQAGGLSVMQFEAELSTRLANYVRNPQVSVLVAEYRSQPVSVLGDVGIPGVLQLRGQKTLVELIALAGGVKADAGDSVTVTRDLSEGNLPIAGAATGPDGRTTIGHVNLHKVMEGSDPANNIVIKPNDIIMVPKAKLLYVVGQVLKPGGYILTENNSLSVLQAVALAGGLTNMASAKKARILKEQPGNTARLEVPTDVKKIMDGQAPDVALHADDILFIPTNLPKSAGAKALETAIGMAGAAVFRIP